MRDPIAYTFHVCHRPFNPSGIPNTPSSCGENYFLPHVMSHLFPLLQDLCHSHSDEATIQQKITTIITCFIHSSTPPTLQIDIPPEQAQHILENRQDLGPYIFREAQVVCMPLVCTVFVPQRRL